MPASWRVLVKHSLWTNPGILAFPKRHTQKISPSTRTLHLLARLPWIVPIGRCQVPIHQPVQHTKWILYSRVTTLPGKVHPSLSEQSHKGASWQRKYAWKLLSLLGINSDKTFTFWWTLIVPTCVDFHYIVFLSFLTILSHAPNNKLVSSPLMPPLLIQL